jgi:glucose-6-phosphate 1-epimerase
MGDDMDLSPLSENFAIPGVLQFEDRGGLVCARVTTPAASATVFLQGAHVAAWQPEGFAPVLFLSDRSEFAPGKAIRGGIPICFPWFGPDATGVRSGGQPGPSHGFARTQVWDLAFAAMAGEDLHLTLTLGPTEMSRSLGYDRFRVAYQVTIGRTLNLQLTVANDADGPLVFEEALHTYYAVADVRSAMLTGLAGVSYLDKTDGMRAKVQPPEPLVLTGTTDRVYVGTEQTCVVEDSAGVRRVTVAKGNSASTVVWNPWAEVASSLPDMEPGGWIGMLCVETANVGENAVTLAPGQAHTMRAQISVAAVG